jgi:hypothetical protein
MYNNIYLNSLSLQLREILLEKGYVILHDVILPHKTNTQPLGGIVNRWHIDSGFPLLGIYQSKDCIRQYGTEFGLIDDLKDMTNITPVDTVLWDNQPYESKLVLFTNKVKLPDGTFLVHRTSPIINPDVTNKDRLLGFVEFEQCKSILSSNFHQLICQINHYN